MSFWKNLFVYAEESSAEHLIDSVLLDLKTLRDAYLLILDIQLLWLFLFFKVGLGVLQELVQVTLHSDHVLLILARTASKEVFRDVSIADWLLILILNKLFGVDTQARKRLIESWTSKMELLIFIQQSVIDVEHKEEFGDVASALNKVLGQNSFSFIVVKVFDLHLKSELLGQILSFYQKVSLLHVVNLFILFVIQRDLMCLSSLVDMAEHLALEINVHIVCLGLRDVRHIVRIVQHCPVLIDGVKGALHQLSTFQQEVNVVREHLLAVAVALDLEHELAASHPVCDLESLV